MGDGEGERIKGGNGMIKFTGRIIRDPLGHEPDYYDVRLTGPLYSEEGVRMCGQIASQLCGNYLCPETMSWGYEGKGPDHTAASLLAYSHTFDDNWVFSYSRWDSAMPLAMKYHKAFAIDIVKHFGDKWEISADEVQAWVKMRKNTFS